MSNPQSRWNQAVGWASNHIGVVLFVAMILGGAAGAWVAAQAWLKFYSPASYFFGGLAGAILTVLLVWAVWAFARWVRHGPLPRAAESTTSSPGVSISPPPAVRSPDPPDVFDAKVQLMAFVRRRLSPAARPLTHLVQLAGFFVKSLDPNHPQAELAWIGVVKVLPIPENHVRYFDTAETLRAAELTAVDQGVQDALQEYGDAVRSLANVIKATRNKSDDWKESDMARAFREWLPLHQEVVSELRVLSTDIHFIHIRRFSMDGALVDFESQKCLDEFYQKI